MMMQTSNAILKRNKVIGHSVVIEDTGDACIENKITNVFQPVNPKNLTAFMFHLYEKKGFKPNRTRESYENKARDFLASVGEDAAVELMLEAARVSTHPWGFAFLERLRLERKC